MSGSVIQFPLRMGLAQDANPKSAPMSSLKTGTNVRWVKDGVIGKCYGSAPLGTLPGGSGAPLRFITRGEELSYTDGTTLYRWSPTTTSWVAADRVGEVGLEWSTLIDDTAGIAQSDIVIRNNVLCHAYVTGDPSVQAGSASQSVFDRIQCLQVIDWQTGRTLLSPANAMQGGEFMRLILCGSYGVLLTSSGTHLYAYRVQLDEATGISLDTTTYTIATDLRTDADPHGIQSRFDAIVLASGEVVIAYEKASSGIIVKKFSVAAGILTATAYSLAESTQTGVRCISLGESGGSVYCAYNRIYSAPECRVYIFRAASADLSQLAAPTQIDDYFLGHHISVVGITSTQALVVYSGARGISSVMSVYPVAWPETTSVLFDTSTGSPVASTERRSAGVMITSGIVAINGRKYVFARDASYGEEQYWDPTWTDGLIFGKEYDDGGLSHLPSMSSYLVEIEYGAHSSAYATPPHRVVGKIDHDIAAPFKQGFTSRAASVDTFTVLGATTFQATADPQSFNFRAGLRLVTATTDLARRIDPWRCVSVATEAYIAGSGMLWAWDGRSVFDLAMRAPMILACKQNTGSTPNGVMSVGSYIYQTHAEYRSHAGILHRGPMSTTFTVNVVSATGYVLSVNLVIAANSIDCKESDSLGFGTAAALKSYFNIFRSEANGSVLYERTIGPRFDSFINQPNTSPATFLDLYGDNNVAVNPYAPNNSFSNPQIPLASRPQLYVATGELEDVQPPAPYTACLHLGRVFLVAGDRRTLWFSKAIEDNPGVAPGFNADFVRIFDRKITALASYADRLIIFFERGAKFMVGDGPTVANTDDRFSTPQSLQGEIGTTNPRSIVVTPVGVFFQSTDGQLYVIDGGLAMQWVGRDARDVLDAYPVVTAAVHIADQAEVRFACRTLDGTSGVFLVYDYQRSTWTTRTTPSGASVTDACLWQGSFLFATAAGVYQENDNHFDGTGTLIPSTIVLNPIAPAGPVSWHRVRRVQLLGESKAAHALTVSLVRDFGSTPMQTKTWAEGSDVTAPGPLERAQVALKYQKLQAIEIHITDAGTVLAGEGFQLEGVALLVQAKQGLARITTSRRG